MHQKNGGHQLPGALVDIEKGTKKFFPDMLEITKKEITKKGTFGLLKILGGAGYVPPVAPPPFSYAPVFSHVPRTYILLVLHTLHA
jgi:hypothetical protein